MKTQTSNVAPMLRTDENVHPLPTRTRRHLTGEYVPVTGYHYKQQKILAMTADDVELELSLQTYDRMENDPTIAKDKRILITSVLCDDLQLAPGQSEEHVGKEEYTIYREIMQFCERVYTGTESPFRSTLAQWFGNSIKYGHGISEIEWEYRTDGSDTDPEVKPESKPKITQRAFEKVMTMFNRERHVAAESSDPIQRPALKNETTRLMPKGIKVKPRGTVKFAVDEFMNILGLLPNRAGVDPLRLKWNELLEREKFMILTPDKQNEDPRGRSVYRPCYNWYNLKVQLPSEILRFILEEIVPKGVATLPPDAKPYEQETDPETGEPQFNDDGTPKMITQVQSFLNAIERFRSGAGVVIPHLSTLEPYKKGLTGSNDANLFKNILKLIDDQIEGSILNQTLAQSEGEHQARSASQQIAEILYNLTFWYRWVIAQSIVSDLFIPAVRMNFGDWAIKYIPQVSLGDFNRRDWGDDLKNLADGYFKGFIDDSQRPELMQWLNMPRPGPSRQEQQLEIEAEQDPNGEARPRQRTRPDQQSGSKNRNKGNGTEKKNGQTASVGSGSLDTLGHHGGRSSFFKRNI